MALMVTVSLPEPPTIRRTAFDFTPLALTCKPYSPAASPAGRVKFTVSGVEPVPTPTFDQFEVRA